MISEHANPAAALGGTDCGGQNVYVDQVSRGVARLGFDVDVYTRADDPAALDVLTLASGARVVPVRAGPLVPVAKDAIWPHITEFLDVAQRLAQAHGPYDLIHANFWMSGWVGARLREQWGVPLVEIFHALGVVKRQHQGEADTSPRERIDVERAVVASSDRIIAQCPTEVDELVEWYGAERRVVTVVPSGVDTGRFYPVPRLEARALLGLSSEEPILVYVGRLVPRKGVDNVLRALGELKQRHGPPCRLLVVGGETDGPDLSREPEMRRLMRLTTDLDLQNQITFVGRRPGDCLRLYYSAADLFVSTPWYEPYGLTPLEAMACGTPVVCSAVGGITFTVADGVTGFLVPPEDPVALADRLEQIVSDDDLRSRFARQARQRVEGNFTWPIVARRTAEVYRELLGARAASRKVA